MGSGKDNWISLLWVLLSIPFSLNPSPWSFLEAPPPAFTCAAYVTWACSRMPPLFFLYFRPIWLSPLFKYPSLLHKTIVVKTLISLFTFSENKIVTVHVFLRSSFRSTLWGGGERWRESQGSLKYYLITCSTLQHCITLKCGQISMLVPPRPKFFIQQIKSAYV